MAKLTAALCLSCASAMVYNNPTAVTPRRTGVSFLPVQLQSETQRQHLQNSSHARIAREARSATLQRCPGTAPRRNSTSVAHHASSARGKNLLNRAGRGARSERPRARRETRASSRKREKTAPRRTRPSSAPRPATRSRRAR
jgi:hypothetical protein